MPRRSPEEVRRILEQTRTAQSPSLPRVGAIVAITATLLVVVGIAVFNIPKLRMYAGNPTASDIHVLCQQWTERSLKNIKGKEADFGKAFLGSMMPQMCAEMRRTCEAEPRGAECRHAQIVVREMVRGK